MPADHPKRVTTGHPAGPQAVRIAASSHPGSGQGRSAVDRPSPPAPRLIGVGVGVDSTPSGRDAVVLAWLLARATGAEVMLIAIVEESLVLLPGPDEVSPRALHKQARATLAQLRDSLAPEARIVIQTGALIWRALESVIAREHRDLLVIGSGHHGAEGQVRLGQNAQQLLSDLECPIAIAPRGLRDRDKPRLGRIGVGFDGEPEARPALRLAASIAAAAGAELEVLGVVDDRVSGGLRTGQVVLEGDAIVDRELESLMERALIATEADGVPARVQITPGKPSEALRSLAARVDLLVIGSSGSGPAGRLSLGRTGKALTAGCPCPLMIVPRPRR